MAVRRQHGYIRVGSTVTAYRFDDDDLIPQFEAPVPGNPDGWSDRTVLGKMGRLVGPRRFSCLASTARFGVAADLTHLPLW